MNKVLIKGNPLYPPPIKLELLCGIPGSGKSTYAAKFPEALVLNRDTYRELLTGLKPSEIGFYYSDEFKVERFNYEKLITNIIETQIKHTAPWVKHIIVDQTNISVDYLLRFWDLIPVTQITVFNVELQTAINRDSARERHAGIKVIQGMYDKFQRFLPELEDAFGLNILKYAEDL